MFKLVGESGDTPTMITVDMKAFIVARDYEKFANCAANGMHKLSSAVDEVMNEREGTNVPTHNQDVIEICFSLPEQEVEANTYSDFHLKEKSAACDIAIMTHVRSIFFTRNRRFTNEERNYYGEEASKCFLKTAAAAGAMYAIIDLNGHKTVWYNDESHFDACEMSIDELDARATGADVEELEDCVDKLNYVGDLMESLSEAIDGDTTAMDEYAANMREVSDGIEEIIDKMVSFHGDED